MGGFYPHVERVRPKSTPPRKFLVGKLPDASTGFRACGLKERFSESLG